MAQKFVKGDPRICRTGRPKNKGNITTEQLRGLVQSFLERNMDKLQSDFDKLKPFERLQVMDRLLKHCLPNLQSIQMEMDVNRLSDEQVNLIIKELMSHENTSRKD